MVNPFSAVEESAGDPDDDELPDSSLLDVELFSVAVEVDDESTNVPLPTLLDVFGKTSSVFVLSKRISDRVMFLDTIMVSSLVAEVESASRRLLPMLSLCSEGFLKTSPLSSLMDNDEEAEEGLVVAKVLVLLSLSTSNDDGEDLEASWNKITPNPNRRAHQLTANNCATKRKAQMASLQ